MGNISFFKTLSAGRGSLRGILLEVIQLSTNSRLSRTRDLEKHFSRENDGENISGDGEKEAFETARGNRRSFHGQGDAVDGDEEQHRIVEILLLGEIEAPEKRTNYPR